MKKKKHIGRTFPTSNRENRRTDMHMTVHSSGYVQALQQESGVAMRIPKDF